MTPIPFDIVKLAVPYGLFATLFVALLFGWVLPDMRRDKNKLSNLLDGSHERERQLIVALGSMKDVVSALGRMETDLAGVCDDVKEIKGRV